MSLFEKKRKMHPIFKEAIELAYHGVEPIEFDDDAIEELKQSLAPWIRHPDLIDAVVELIELAFYLDKNGSPTASRKIVEVVRTITDPLEELAKRN
ncbi:MAG: hypothetical protein LUQ65_06000 [Candidatus Helarchaeota archaeon]|nr:hypothetical protein [Candidatus Helarchaeota archaeon]